MECRTRCRPLTTQPASGDVVGAPPHCVRGRTRPSHSTRKECVFLTDGADLGQLQNEVEMRYSVGGRNVDILEIKALGAIGNCKT